MRSMERFDVLIVGGGSAGCVLARRLAERGDRTVCLLEAGPFVTTNSYSIQSSVAALPVPLPI